METNLKITSAVIICISFYLIAPKIANSRGSVGTLTADILGITASDRSTNSSVTSQDSKDIYVAPNYGGPDSQHGSGTR
ncbi:hypothetical protein I8748_19330 [Nostoc sp. CENA67]|uniref:Uncharacterized protein n=1 Tax=Amazonocrinis nigriterrae CENA67 TaxID=2794033 RepID=A0A8J7HQU7_9NOST|nr:hypothetical protein [Amazonocrinis nigriterrae]MBH8564313.1 hypothetical protein [Amazonocrinis nigriterrae CENA67]